MKKSKRLYLKNTKKLKKDGVKKYDYMTITEPGCFKRSIFKYKNLVSWDKRAWTFQKKHGTVVQDTYESLYMPGDWFRIIERNEFKKKNLVYGQIESARMYILDQVTTALDNHLDKKIPFIFVTPYGEDLFTPLDDGSDLLTMNSPDKRSAGREKEREALEKDLRDIYPTIEKDVLDALKPLSSFTFRKRDDRFDGLDLFIFGGLAAAKGTSFKTFLKDFVEKEQPIEILDPLIARLTKKYKKKIFKNVKSFNV